MSSAESLHRREFARQCLGSLGAVAVTAEIAAAAPPPAMPEDPNVEPAESPPVELLLLTALVKRYPSEQYSDDVLRGIYGDIAGDVSRGKILRSVPLKNSDEPSTVFRVIRGDALRS